MPCTRIGNAIVCGPAPRPRKCVGCGQSTKANRLRLCGKTCDKPVCVGCTTMPAPAKDLCPNHAAQWKARANG